MGILNYIFGKRIVAQTDNEWTFLKAARSNDLEGVSKALQKGVNINIKDNAGRSALWFVACNHHFNICEFLLQKGADAYLANAEGYTPFDMAYMVRVNNPEILVLFEKYNGKYKY